LAVEQYGKRGLISNFEKYRPTFEYSMLMAEYPELKNKTMDAKQPYNFFDPAFASTSATNAQ